MAKVIEEAHEAPSLGGLMVLAFFKVHGVLKPLDLMVLLHLKACGELDGVWSTNPKA